MKLICAADIHLGKVSSVNRYVSEENLYKYSSLEAWKNFIIKCNEIYNEKGLDGILIAGDILDSNATYNTHLNYFEEGINLLDKNIKVIIIAGNHDRENLKPVYNTLNQENKDRIYFIGQNQTWEKLENVLDLPVYGFSMDVDKYTGDPFEVGKNCGILDSEKGIVILHGDYNSQGNDYGGFRNSKKNINQYLTVVGHLHAPYIEKLDKTTLLSPGSLIGNDLGYGELGEHGAYYIEIDKDNIKTEFMSLSNVIFERNINIDISNYEPTENTLLNILRNIPIKNGKLNIYRINLTGKTDFYTDLENDINNLLSENNYIKVNEDLYIEELNNNVLRNVDPYEYMDYEDIRGEIARLYKHIDNIDFNRKSDDRNEKLLGEILKVYNEKIKQAPDTSFEKSNEEIKEDIKRIIKNHLQNVLEGDK